MSIYVVIEGDTLELISRKKYGTEQNVGLIINANPGLVEPLIAGIDIVIPTRPNAPTLQPTNVPSDSENGVVLKIEGERFRSWERMTITRSIDTMDTLEFSSPFKVDDQKFREIFKPFSYKDAGVFVGGLPLFTGTMLTPAPELSINRKAVSISGYSLPGVLNDCSLPASAFPLEFREQGLQDIAKTIASYFGISVEFTDQQGPVFDRVAAKPGQTAFAFLTKLAKERNFIIASTSDGKLIFQRAVASGSPVARLAEGTAPVTGVGMTLNSQGYFSHITGIQPSVIGLAGDQYTVKNPHLKGVIRPHTFTAPDTSVGNLKESVEAKMGRMFAEVAPVTVSLSTWRDSEGALWAPNTTITLIAPDVMIYSEYEFLIRSVSLTRDSNNETAVLDLVIPEAFKGQIPRSLPWDS